MGQETERAVYLQRIDPEQREEYIEAHDTVPDGVTDAMARAGVTDFELYIRDEIAVCILEAENIDAYVDSVTHDESVEEWERYVGRFKQDGVDVESDPGDQIPFMDRIWSFTPNDL